MSTFDQWDYRRSPSIVPLVTTLSDDKCREILAIICRAAKTPLMGVTSTEIEALTRLSAANVAECLESLLADKSIVPMGQRAGESVYGVFDD
jgi:hypothetical protein